ncbi:hypothetical protein FRB91_009638 [Serendipita sp. 411]|nr:hypothetical protein FRC18_000073 [Serendipita sp. 400]KAG8858577.1 hypothetical protein FRB91_009638 [Serendipita sp. 411]
MSHSRVLQWLQREYPKPKIDPEWVKACVEFLQEELTLNPTTQITELNEHTRLQLLQSDLSDSMLRNTGFPSSIHKMKAGVIGTPVSGGPILVQVTAIMEIGASAFTLKNVRQARLDKADMTGLTKDKGPEGEEENNQRPQLEEEDATAPPYPRSMLSLMISDGTYTVKAIEMKRLNELILGETQLGCKILLSGVKIRGGIALLEPSNVQVVGYQNDDLHAEFDAQFLKSLQRRLGVRDDDLSEGRVPQQDDHSEERTNGMEDELVINTGNRNQSSHFGSNMSALAVRLSPTLAGQRVLPPSSTSTGRGDISDSFDDFEVDDEFLQQIDEAEEKLVGTEQKTARHDQTQPSATVSRLAHKMSRSVGNSDIIELEDSEEEKENLWKLPKRVVQHRVDEIDTIELSD